MASRGIKSLSLPERLLTEVEKVAKAQKRPVNDVLAAAVESYIKDDQWAGLKLYGREKARESGLREEDVDRLIAESRNSMGR